MAERPRRNVGGLALHGLSVGAKFLLLLYMGRSFSLHDLGVYGLYLASLEIAQYLIGAGFGPHTARELPSLGPADRAAVVRSQVWFQAAASLLVLPGCSLLFLTGALPWDSAPWFFPTLLGLHAGREFSRLLIALGRPFAATAVLSAGQGLWIPVLLLWGLLGSSPLALLDVLACWSGAAVVSALVGLGILYRHGLLSPRSRAESVRQLRAGMRSAWVFLLLPVCQQLILFSDRYFIAHHFGEALTGVYTFHSSIARFLETLVYTGFVAPAFPLLVRAFSSRGDAFTRERGRLAASLWRASLGLSLPFVAGIFVALALVDRAGLAQGLWAYFLLLGRAVVANLSQALLLPLYAAHRNRSLLGAAFAGVICNLVLNGLLVPRFGLDGAALSTLLSACLQWWVAVTQARNLTAVPRPVQVRDAA